MTPKQLERLAGLVIETWARRSERTVYRQAIEAALAASARTGTRPSRASVRTIALAWLEQRLDAELDDLLGHHAFRRPEPEPVPESKPETPTRAA